MKSRLPVLLITARRFLRGGIIGTGICGRNMGLGGALKKVENGKCKKTLGKLRSIKNSRKYIII